MLRELRGIDYIILTLRVRVWHELPERNSFLER